LYRTGPQEKARTRVLDRLVKVLDAPLSKDSGTLSVLRRGFKDVNANFTMCEFKPGDNLNPAVLERYSKVRLRVMRQVHYSVANAKKSIDLVFFVNGIPVATVESKTTFTQSVHDAVEQYKRDRLPKDPATHKREPLLAFGARALVHFAVDDEEVWMSTHLQGAESFFLPFNKGDDGRAGNPVNPSGPKTAYFGKRPWRGTPGCTSSGSTCTCRSRGRLTRSAGMRPSESRCSSPDTTSSNWLRP
jgi:type I restriction enzyme R subunit